MTLLDRAFPYGALSVNACGSILMGLLYVMLFERIDVHVKWRTGSLNEFTWCFLPFQLKH